MFYILCVEPHHLCHQNCVGTPSVVISVGLYYDSISLSSDWKTTVDPAEKTEGCFLSIIVLIIFLLMGLILYILIIYVYWHSIYLWQKALYGSAEQQHGWTRKPCSQWC